MAATNLQQLCENVGQFKGSETVASNASPFISTPPLTTKFRPSQITLLLLRIPFFAPFDPFIPKKSPDFLSLFDPHPQIHIFSPFPNWVHVVCISKVRCC
ncbi:hypothetical protein Dimus_032394 [Dionaea muscipula]